MSFRNAFTQVGTSGPNASMPERLFRSFLRGEMTHDEYLTAAAIWVADHSREYACRRYPPIDNLTLDYARSRVKQTKDTRDPAAHRRIGAWSHVIRMLLDQNTADQDLLHWALKICQEKGLKSQVRSIELRLAEFADIWPEHLSVATEALMADSKAKSWESRSA